MRIDIITVPYRYDAPNQGLGAGPDALVRGGIARRPERVDSQFLNSLGRNDSLSAPLGANRAACSAGFISGNQKRNAPAQAAEPVKKPALRRAADFRKTLRWRSERYNAKP